MDRKVRRAIASINDNAWTSITYPNAIYDDQADTWIFDAQVAEVPTPPLPPAEPTAPTGG
jgi:hypothetical protein